MSARRWFCLGLVTSSMLVGCSTLSEDPRNHANGTATPDTAVPELAATTNSSNKKSVLVIAATSQTAMTEVLAAGGNVTHDLPLLNAVGAKLTSGSIDQLSKNPDIMSLVVDDDISTEKSSEPAASNDAVTWLIEQQGLPTQNAWLDSLIDIETHGLTGRGVGLAIIDTGIAEAGSYPDWNPNIIGRYNAVINSEGGLVHDTTGHGTHLSSLIAGMGNRVKGVAPNASLVPVKAFDSEGSANFLDVIRAVQWVVKNSERLGIRILNLSVSASAELPYHLDPLNRALSNAWASGLVVVVSTGNQGPAPTTVTAPGNNPWLISVGAASYNDTRQAAEVAAFSGRGPTTSGHIKPNIVAPGTRLAGFLPKDATRPSHEPVEMTDTGLWITSGASQASAVVSGMVALLLEARPELSNDDVKCLIANSATPLIDDNRVAVSPMAQGRGLINLRDALTSTNTDCAERFEGFSVDTAIEGAYSNQ